jgi:hypothetical protein
MKANDRIGDAYGVRCGALYALLFEIVDGRSSQRGRENEADRHCTDEANARESNALRYLLPHVYSLLPDTRTAKAGFFCTGEASLSDGERGSLATL